ncbi:LysE family translocator [Vibrio sp. S4M6]|uniref:LysE family translocator n=1 Tax=Vibrio sinus TaxID=2946865 RepID=UPI00202A476A|nr:LysE family translocator [Vibrio sinus]MCL9781977.1 LysE family translocator [Vibrio sinus]
MSFESALTFFVVMVIFSITPGPGVFAMLARALVSGARNCFTLAIGMVCSDLIYLILACLGLATMAEHFTEVFTVIRYIGAVYLIYLGYKMFKTLPDIKNEAQSEGIQVKGKSHTASFLQGFLISASNPKVILFYIAFLPTFIDLTTLHAKDIVLVSVLAAMALILGLMFVAYCAGRAAKLLKSPSAHRKLNKSAGGIMVLAGAYLALNK